MWQLSYTYLLCGRCRDWILGSPRRSNGSKVLLLICCSSVMNYGCLADALIQELTALIRQVDNYGNSCQVKTVIVMLDLTRTTTSTVGPIITTAMQCRMSRFGSWAASTIETSVVTAWNTPTKTRSMDNGWSFSTCRSVVPPCWRCRRASTSSICDSLSYPELSRPSVQRMWTSIPSTASSRRCPTTVATLQQLYDYCR